MPTGPILPTQETEGTTPAQEAYPLRPHRGLLTCADLGIRIEFQYNPETVEETKELNWHKENIYGLNEPLISFSCGDVRELQMEILLDSHFSNYDVGKALDDLDDLTIPYNITGRRTTDVPVFGMAKAASGPIWGMPPVCKLSYGGKVRRVILRSKKVIELLHATTEKTSLTRQPTRAKVQLSFFVIENIRSLVNLNVAASLRGVTR